MFSKTHQQQLSPELVKLLIKVPLKVLTPSAFASTVVENEKVRSLQAASRGRPSSVSILTDAAVSVSISLPMHTFPLYLLRQKVAESFLRLGESA